MKFVALAAILFAALWLQMMIGQRRLAAADARRLAGNKADDRLWRIVDSEYRHRCSRCGYDEDDL